MTKNQWYVLALIAISQLLVGVCVRRFSSIFVAILDFADVEYLAKP
ncbi:hypothetical protein RJD24_07400 [Bacillaceae bacterium IKA-2]|nr:hypothetical protein RJD24_07400 [Bacillaceae bacterium IKA-2]